MVNRRVFRALLLITVLAASPRCFAQSQSKGHFDGSLILRPNPDGRNMTVVEQFSYTDWNGHTLTAVPGFVSDGATIPRAAWSIIGGPWDGKYRQAAVIHDVGCETHKFSWKITDRMFYEAMIDSQVPQYLALTMYYAVLTGGPRWELVATKTASTADQLDNEIAISKEEFTKENQSQMELGTEGIEVTRTEYAGPKPTQEAKIYATLPSASQVSDAELNSVLTRAKASQEAGKPMSPDDIDKLVIEKELLKTKFKY